MGREGGGGVTRSAPVRLSKRSPKEPPDRSLVCSVCTGSATELGRPRFRVSVGLVYGVGMREECFRFRGSDLVSV